ncbi:hypothetical protein LOTGIDRAFT_233523 [Lottia gigantea]|uniref:Uncharacterized protein n=1 Tax=Lottia gigantea TaxID=225164 RepID=V4BQ78_LOTGI|nr:hypothetical protein LOTGIDRAFT_233523 [Lottia gigantea]ESO91034.1 hypothetical protein LOTGIDRAFT_233523 [Lottia gigantea]
MFTQFKIFIALAFAGCVVNGQIYTDNCPSVSGNVSQCNIDTPIADVPSISTSNILTPTYSLNLTVICSSSRLNDFKTAASCVLNSYRHCGDNDYKTLVVKEAAYKDAITYACDNIGPIMHVQNCIGDSVTDCIRNREAREKRTDGATPDRSEPFSDYRDHFCARRQITKECTEHDEDFLACVGTGTASIYLEYYRKMTPAGCGATSIFIASSLLLVSLLSTFMKYL